MTNANSSARSGSGSGLYGETTRDSGRGGIDMRTIGAIGIGAAAMYFLDPDRGARRRARVRDALVHYAHVVGDAAGTTARDLRNRATGAAAAARSRARRDLADDTIIVERVRAELGRVVSHPSAILVSSDEGRVTLSGPILESEADKLVARARKVRGVQDVDDQLERHATAGDVPALQGGRPRRGGEFELRQENWTPAARLLVGTGGGMLAVSGMRRNDMLGSLLTLAGLALLGRSTTNTEVRRLIGIGGRRAVDLQKTINVGVPVETAYTFFTDYENFPSFMSHVREVRDLGNGRSHWVVDGPAGVAVEWDAEITEQRPNELLAWKSIEGSPVRHAGVLSFQPGESGGTRVDVKMSYNPPAGAIGHTAAILFRVDPKRQLDDDLSRAKTALETGVPPHDAQASEAAPPM